MNSSENSTLTCIEDLQEIIQLVDDVFAGLATKRVTLEEKMIVNYFKELSSKTRAATDALNSIGTKNQTCDALPELQELAFETKESLRDLLKIINYNLNFLEQYFEHDYYDRLVYEKRYVERMDAVILALKKD